MVDPSTSSGRCGVCGSQQLSRLQSTGDVKVLECRACGAWKDLDSGRWHT